MTKKDNEKGGGDEERQNEMTRKIEKVRKRKRKTVRLR